MYVCEFSKIYLFVLSPFQDGVTHVDGVHVAQFDDVVVVYAHLV